MTAWWVIYTFCVNDTCKYMLHVYVSFYLFQIRKKCMVWLWIAAWFIYNWPPGAYTDPWNGHVCQRCMYCRYELSTHVHCQSQICNSKFQTFDICVFQSKVNPARNQEKDVFLSKHSRTNTKFRSVQTPGTGLRMNNAQWIDIVAVLSFACKP